MVWYGMVCCGMVWYGMVWYISILKFQKIEEAFDTNQIESASKNIQNGKNKNKFQLILIEIFMPYNHAMTSSQRTSTSPLMTQGKEFSGPMSMLNKDMLTWCI